MNRPTPVKTDNFFLLIFRALRHRRVPIALRIASHNVILVALALVIYACVMGLQFKQAMHEQADALGESLTTQTATSATELLVSNDILSLNVLLNNLTKNPLVAHAAIYSVDNRIMAEAGQRPKNGLLGEAEGLYQSNITFQDVKAGQLRISLDMQQFQQPMTISLQSMGILSAILLALALALSLRLGRHISTPLMQLRIWLRDIDEHTPATDRQDEIGALSRTLSSLVTQQNAALQRERAFTRHVSHELRTPLSILNNSLAVLRLPGCDAQKHARSLLRMEGALAGMKMTIELFLSLAREPRKVPHEAIDLAAVVTEQIEKYQQLYPLAAGALVYVGPPAITLQIHEAIARSVVQNLLGNAVQHGAGKIRVILTGQRLVIINNRMEQLASPGFGFGLEIVTRACTHAGWRLETRRTLHTFRAHVMFT